MTPEQLQGQIKYAVEKAGHTYVPGGDYALTRPIGVPAKLAEGREKLATMELNLGEELVIMGPAGGGDGQG